MSEKIKHPLELPHGSFFGTVEVKQRIIEQPPRIETLDECIRRHILFTMEHCGGSIIKATRSLLCSRATVYRLLRSYGEFEKYRKYDKRASGGKWDIDK